MFLRMPSDLYQIKQTCPRPLAIMDSANSHLSFAVLVAFRATTLKYAIILGGLTMFIQSIDVAPAS